MAAPGLKIVEKGGVCHLSGILNEYADFTPLLTRPEPLRLNIREVSRLNSIGIRHLLKFLADWGSKDFSYDECPSEFVDQINMVPALLGMKGQGKVLSFFVPHICTASDHEEEVLMQVATVEPILKAGGPMPQPSCRKCGSPMNVVSESFFAFLTK